MRTWMLGLGVSLLLAGAAWAANPSRPVSKPAATIQTDPHRFAGTIQEIDKQKSTIIVVGQEVTAASAPKKINTKTGKPQTFKYTLACKVDRTGKYSDLKVGDAVTICYAAQRTVGGENVRAATAILSNKAP